MEISLDTNVLNDKKFLNWLTKQEVTPLLSSVAYMEIAYHVLKKHQNLSILDTTLKELGIKIVSFDKELSEVSALSAKNRWDFKENARDYAIGSISAIKNIPFITNNKKHFVWLKQVYTPDEFMIKFKQSK